MFIALASTKMAFFIVVAHALSLLWQLSFHCNRKSEIWPLLHVTADILTTVLQNCSLSNPLPNKLFSPDLIGCHGNRKPKFEKKYS